MLLIATKDTADVQNLQPTFKLCCKARKMCKLCLVVDAELYIQLQKDRIDEGSAGPDEEDYSKETSNPRGIICCSVDTSRNSFESCPSFDSELSDSIPWDESLLEKSINKHMS